ncbi:hypothetical protein PRIPAC_94170 [Pristionchus pacificus]|nr:hypothetical protein PRIPAC_94170 [Pristionchus pacificus]|eukprot:PDM80516.1 hypothetical protein PRIPAC_35508 [Pristionchus pacificus]
MSTAVVKRGGVTSPSTSSSVHSCAFQQKSVDGLSFDEEEKKEEEEVIKERTSTFVFSHIRRNDTKEITRFIERKRLTMDETRKVKGERGGQGSFKCPLLFVLTLTQVQLEMTETGNGKIKDQFQAQISFLQRESGNMLRGLHSEIERLTIRLKESRRLLDIGHCASEREMAERLEEKEKTIEELESALQEKEDKLMEIERRVSTTMERMNDQINIQADRIRQLNGELQDRTQSVAQLTSQLRAYRLKEAMNLAQQRRRVSNVTGGPSSPLVSPSSPHRSFPPFSTYPGGSQSARIPSRDNIPQSSVLSLSSSSSNNIDEKPRSSKPRIRSNSAFGQPSH